MLEVISLNLRIFHGMKNERLTIFVGGAYDLE
jgi:hypothetical protein